LSNHLLSDAAEQVVAHPTASVGTHDDQVRGEFFGVLDDAGGDVLDPGRVDMPFDFYLFWEGCLRHCAQVTLGFIRFRQVTVSVYRLRGAFLDKVQQRHRRAEGLGERGGRRQGSLGQLRSIQGNKDVVEHRLNPCKELNQQVNVKADDQSSHNAG